MPLFIAVHDVLPPADVSGSAFAGFALRYGWDRYQAQDGGFVPLPGHSLIGEFTDYEAAHANLRQLCREAVAGDCAAPARVLLVEVSQSQVVPLDR